MTLAETIVSNAIRYSMRRFCFANIIIAGPICAGKKSLAQQIAECSDAYNLEKNVTIFYQDDYYKEYDELEDTPFGVKNIDARSAFKISKFLKDVRTFYEQGHISINTFSLRNWNKNCSIIKTNESSEIIKPCIFKSKETRRINILVGTHTIDLLKKNQQYREDENEKCVKTSDNELVRRIIPYDIPEAIYIYLNTPHIACMERREKRRIMFPNNLYTVKQYNEYSDFIKKQTEDEIAFQKEMADIVINCD